jgi:hypothetical protein
VSLVAVFRRSSFHVATKAKAAFNEVPKTRAADAAANFGAFSQICDADIVGARRAEERVFAEIERLGLRRHVWELDTKGWTVIEPGSRFRRLSDVDGLSLHPDGSDTPSGGRVAASRFA